MPALDIIGELDATLHLDFSKFQVLFLCFRFFFAK